MGESPQFLQNRYWVLRHGKSVPNEKGLIVSSLENGVLPEFGLCSDGLRQAQLAGELFTKELKKGKILLENVRICYSPFSRTIQTAKAVAGILGIPFESSQCKVILELRERYFGPTYELLSHEKYAEIWALDEKDPFMSPEDGESVADVASRLSTALANIEGDFQGCAILIVSHGDPLQILQTIVDAAKENETFQEADISSRMKAITVRSILCQHRKFAMETAELRRIN